MTLVEVLVALLLTAFVLAIMIPAMIPFMKLVNSSKVHSTSTSDAEIVFQRIDSEVRFAEAINQQGYGATALGDPDDPGVTAQRARYVEWLTPAESSQTGKALCTQWRFVPATNSIEERQWNLESVPPTTFIQRLELAIDQPPIAGTNTEDALSHLPTYPFAMGSASNTQPLQSLTLWVYAGQSASEATTQIKTRFVARNSSIISVTNDNTSSGWGQYTAAGYGDPAGYQDPTAGRKVPLVCSAQVGASGNLIAAFPTGTFRP